MRPTRNAWIVIGGALVLVGAVLMIEIAVAADVYSWGSKRFLAGLSAAALGFLILVFVLLSARLGRAN